MQCSESLHVLLDLMHDTTGRFSYRIPPVAFEMKNIGSQWDIIKYIREFTERKLSYPTDSVNAIRGIFHLFEKTPYPVYHLTGVPIIPPFAHRPRKEDYYEQPVWIARSPEAGFLIGMLWWHNSFSPCRRQTCFPSWSWAGWDQPVMDSLLFGHGAVYCVTLVWKSLSNFQTNHFFDFQQHTMTCLISYGKRKIRCTFTSPPKQ